MSNDLETRQPFQLPRATGLSGSDLLIKQADAQGAPVEAVTVAQAFQLLTAADLAVATVGELVSNADAQALPLQSLVAVYAAADVRESGFWLRVASNGTAADWELTDLHYAAAAAHVQDKIDEVNAILTAASVASEAAQIAAATIDTLRARVVFNEQQNASLMHLLNFAVPAVPLSAIDTSGWRGDYTIAPPEFQPDSDPVIFPIARAGFGRDAQPTTHRGEVTINRSVYETDMAVAFDEWILATDSVAGFANNSQLIAEKPTGRWGDYDQIVVGDFLYWEAVFFHHGAQNGEMVPAVEVRANDAAGNVAKHIVSDSYPSTWGKDAVPCTVFSGTLDISQLQEGLITRNGKAVPWIGDERSVLDSADNADFKDFSPRYFRKDLARHANPPLAYLDAVNGDDDNGIWSTDAAAAKAAPFMTPRAAQKAIFAEQFLAVTGGIVDGCEIRGGAGDHILQSPASTDVALQEIAALTLTSDPDIDNDLVNYALNGRYFPRLGDLNGFITPSAEATLRFKDCKLTRALNQRISSHNQPGTTTPVPVRIVQDDVVFDNNNSTLSMMQGAVHGYVAKMHVLNHGGNPNIFGIAGDAEFRLLRGISGDLSGGAVDGWCVLGHKVDNAGGLVLREPEKGSVFAYFDLDGCDGSTLNLSGTGFVEETVTGVAWFMGRLNYTGTTDTSAVNLCSNGGNSRGAVIGHITATGYNSVGRWNMFYSGFDSPGNVDQLHELHLFVGNIPGQFNIKNLRFPPFHPNNMGNFALDHGTGSTGNISLFPANTPATEHPLYWGRGSILADTPDIMAAVQFVDYQGTGGNAGTAIAGAGGGNLRLQADSIARGAVHKKIASHDLDGNPLPANGPWDAGCYPGDVIAA